MIELVEAAQHGPLDDDPEYGYDEWRQPQHHPVIQPEIVHPHPGSEGAHHVERAMREVDDIEQAKDDRQPERQHGVEGAIDEPQQELGHHHLVRYAENFHEPIKGDHACGDPEWKEVARTKRATATLAASPYFQRAHLVSALVV